MHRKTRSAFLLAIATAGLLLSGLGAASAGGSPFKLKISPVASLLRSPAPAPHPQAPTRPRQERAVASPFRRPEIRIQWSTGGRNTRIELRRHEDPVAAVEAPRLVSRLDYCAEFTKPNSLRIFLFGTPHNHRSPPV